MSNYLNGILVAAFLVTGTGTATAEPSGSCIGLDQSQLEERLADVETYSVSSHLIPSLLELWQSGHRPDLPGNPDAISVYSYPDQSNVIIAYQLNNCVLATLSVQKDKLIRFLNPELGERADLQSPSALSLQS